MKKELLALTLSATMLLSSCDNKQKKIEANPYATAAHDLMLTVIADYYDPVSHDLHGEPNGSGNSFVWPFASFLEALGDTYELFPQDETIKATYIDALDHGIVKYHVKSKLSTPAGEFPGTVYYNSSAGNRGDYYYDDNAWICLQFLRAYDLLGDKTYLTRAEELLAFFETGWDDALGGGIYWDKSFKSKNTCADGPIAICYLQAYRATKEKHYLDMAKKIVDWMNGSLRDTDGLYIDNLSVSGERNGWKADYNQGTPLAALCLLADVTEDKSYRALADETASAAATNAFTYFVKTGKATIKGNPIYKCWCVGWLMRGFEEYVSLTGEDANAFAAMKYVLDQKTLPNKDENGYYDPYFGTKDWNGENKTEVLQPSGMISVLAACARYDVFHS